MSKYTVEKRAGSITWIHVTEPNEKGEILLIELSECENPGGKNALPVLWKKHGYIDRVLETYVCIHTYVTDTEGNCYGRYNPQTKLSEDGKRSVINFEWMFENTEENKQKLIDECIRIFESATGKSATEEKIEKIEAYATENGLEITHEKPEGWRELNGICSPRGCVVITNQKNFKDKDYIRKLWVY
jgi:hypothetical protein